VKGVRIGFEIDVPFRTTAQFLKKFGTIARAMSLCAANLDASIAWE
jgi:hypothetical protein